jgi:hypothetical protein
VLFRSICNYIGSTELLGGVIIPAKIGDIRSGDELCSVIYSMKPVI